MKKMLNYIVAVSVAILVILSATVVNADDKTVETLKKLGFSPDPSSYKTDALRPGTNPIEAKYDVYTQGYDVTENVMRKFVGSKEKKGENIIKDYTNYYQELTLNKEYNKVEGASEWSVSTSFAATGTGIETHIAKVSFENGNQLGRILLSIYDSKGNELVSKAPTDGYVVSDDVLEMWEVEGLLSVTAGDFDGDGVDEIAVYTPNNRLETADKSVHNNLYVTIFEFERATNTVIPRQTIDITSKENPGDSCPWESSYCGDKKQFYSIPYLAMHASDVSGDGVDDLMAVVSFSTWFQGAKGTATTSTKDLLNPSKTYASILEAYEGAMDGYLTQSIKHKVLVTHKLTDKNKRFILRNANITVGDVTAEGSKEIIIAGNYTSATYGDKTSTTKVTSNRYVEVDGKKALRHIVGYATYETLKNQNPFDPNTDYKWTVQTTGCVDTCWYNEDSTDSAPITVSLCSFQYKGTGYTDRIFVGGQLFDYDSKTGEIAYTADFEFLFSLVDATYSVVWFGKSVAGNISKDVFGREVLLTTLYYKESGEDSYFSEVRMCFQGTRNNALGGNVTRDFSKFDSYWSEQQFTTSVVLLDSGSKSSYLTYTDGDTDVYYSKVDVLAILQAPPLYEELEDDDYIGNSATGFAKSKGDSSETSHGGSLTAGVVAGFEHETSFLGLFSCGGAEYEFSITGSVSTEHSKETSYNYSTGFETSGTTDVAVIFTVPYVRYNCTMYVPEYKLPSESNYNTLCKFRDELRANLEKYIENDSTQKSGTYVKGCSYYEYKYSSYVCADNYQNQLSVLYKVTEEIDFIEKAIASFGKGGTGKWGGTVSGALLPYHYCIPQTPIVTMVDVETYDAIAEVTAGLDKISENVFGEGYKSGDPTTYAHSEADLKAVGKILVADNVASDSGDGFLTNHNLASPGTSQSQSISVETAESDTIGWGAAIENTSVAKVGGAKVGFTVTAEYNGSSTKTTTEGNEYSCTLVAFPADTPADYNYAWKLVAYNANLNGGKVPVVGYITNIINTPPPSIAQSISVENITDTSATITWETGNRPADSYSVSRVLYNATGEGKPFVIAEDIKPVGGNCSYVVEDLNPLETSYYLIESHSEDDKTSVPTGVISITTLPKGLSATISIDGIKQNVIHRNGKSANLFASVEGNEGYATRYQWEIDNGDGWTPIKGETDDEYSFEMSNWNNQDRIRCAASIILSNSAYCVIYSNPVTINCTTSAAGHNVAWDMINSSVKVSLSKDAEPANVFVKAVDSRGVATHIMGDKSSENDITFNLSDIPDERTVNLYIWEDGTLAPLSYPFER